MIIIGGSLSGLTLALVCARRGIAAHVLERRSGPPRRGGGLGVDRGALMRAIKGDQRCPDAHTAPFPLLAGRRRALAWRVLYDWLRLEAQRHPFISIEDGVEVEALHQDEHHASVVTTTGQEYRSPLIVGADGYRSLVRRVLDPEEAEPVYAGYLLWRGLVDEGELPAARQPRHHEEASLVNQAGHRLVAYAVAGHDGSLAMGKRSLSFTWYDGGQSDLLYALGCVSHSGHVLRTLQERDVPAQTRRRLLLLTRQIWPQPWCSVILHALERREVFATPVSEYSPRHLARNHLALVGDAAHVVTPVAGIGFRSGIEDAVTLADCLANHPGDPVQKTMAALAAYEQRRLPQVRAMVMASRKWSRAFVGRRTMADSG